MSFQRITMPRIALGLAVIFTVLVFVATGDARASSTTKSASSQTSPLSAQTDLIPRTVAAAEGIELGYAWNSSLGEMLPSRCIEFAPVIDTSQTSAISMSEITDKTDIMSHLHISGSASVKAVVGSGSVHASMLRDTKISGSSTTLMIHAKVTNGALAVGPQSVGYHARSAYPRLEGLEHPFAPTPTSSELNSAVALSQWAQNLLKEKSDHFRTVCGDSYISKIESGADAVALFSFTSKSTEHKSQVKASLKAKYLGGQVSSSASAETEKSYQDTDIDLKFMQLGGGGSLVPVAEKDLAGAIATLGMQAEANPRFRTMTLSPYPELQTVPSDPLYEAIAEYYWVLSYVANELRDVMHAEAAGRSILKYAGLYYTPWRPGHGPTAPEAGYLGQLDRIEAVRALIYAAIHQHFQPATAQQAHKLSLAKPVRALDGYRIFPNWPEQPVKPPTQPGITPELLAFLQALLPTGRANPHTLKLILPAPLAACPPREYGTIGMAAAIQNLLAQDNTCQKPNESFGSRIALASLAIQWYLMPQSDRACEVNPSSEQCIDFETYLKLLNFTAHNLP